MRNSNYDEGARKLKEFSEARLNSRDALRSEFLKAGFKHSVYADERARRCERFDWKSTDAWPSVYLVTVCDKEVYASAGQQAP